MKAKKLLVLALSVVLMASITIAATVAYFTDTEKVTNTFTVGKVEIDLDEKDVDDSTPDKDRDQANAYHLIPGEDYVKDPTVHVLANSENCYVYVKVENGLSGIEAGDDDTTATYDSIATQITTNGWTVLDDVTNVYYKVHTKSSTQNDYVVFSGFSIAGSVNGSTLATYADKTINVTAYAIQQDGFGDAKTAWDAYVAQNESN